MKIYPHNKSRTVPANVNTAVYINLISIAMALIFMVTMPLLRQPIPLHDLVRIKPHVGILAPIIITIDKEQKYHLNTEMHSEKIFSFETMQTALRHQFKVMDPIQTSICIKSHDTVPYGQVVTLINWLQSVGARHIGLLTTPSSSA